MTPPTAINANPTTCNNCGRITLERYGHFLYRNMEFCSEVCAIAFFHGDPPPDDEEPFELAKYDLGGED